MNKIRFVGLDVHADTIAVAVAEPSGEVRSFGIIANRPESLRKLMHKLSPIEQLRVCYEVGPTGYALYWQLTALGVRCEVIAPTLVPVKAGDRVKLDSTPIDVRVRRHRQRLGSNAPIESAPASMLRPLLLRLPGHSRLSHSV